jgi:hypothetical protein
MSNFMDWLSKTTAPLTPAPVAEGDPAVTVGPRPSLAAWRAGRAASAETGEGRGQAGSGGIPNTPPLQVGYGMTLAMAAASLGTSSGEEKQRPDEEGRARSTLSSDPMALPPRPSGKQDEPMADKPRRRMKP